MCSPPGDFFLMNYKGCEVLVSPMLHYSSFQGGFCTLVKVCDYRDYDTYINAYLLFASTCFAIGPVIPSMTG